MGVRRALIWLPLGLFALLMLAVASGLLRPATQTPVRSALVGQPLPEFVLPPVAPGKPGLSSADFRQGRPRLLNIFASWCIPCAAETPQLLRLRAMGVPVDAVAIRDTRTDVAAFLARYGDPYATIGDDATAKVQLALGSSGVPETYVIDGRGVIVSQHIGDVRADEVDAIAAQVRGAAK